MSAADGRGRGSLPIRWTVRELFLRLRRETPIAFAAFLGGTATIAVLIALQGLLPSSVPFLALIAAGFAFGLVCAPLRDAVVAGFLMGYIAFFVGTAAFALSSSILGDSPLQAVATEAAGGVFVGAVFGVVGGVWTSGGAALGSVLRRRSHAGHIL